MISLFLTFAAAVWFSGVILAIVHVRRAPVAVEDERGFRVLEQPRPTSERARALAMVRVN